ncbi:hypothetical protein COSHB9_03200 [Companilactobacillus alimentarius]
MHSYQKFNPLLSFESFSNKELVQRLSKVLNESGESYETKEKALHLVNEMFFYKLISSDVQDTNLQEKSQKSFGF